MMRLTINMRPDRVLRAAERRTRRAHVGFGATVGLLSVAVGADAPPVIGFVLFGLVLLVGGVDLGMLWNREDLRALGETNQLLAGVQPPGDRQKVSMAGGGGGT